MSKLTIFSKDGSTINLTDKNYVSEGGQGVIYRSGSVIYKIYHDEADTLPQQKFDQLDKIRKKNIITPLSYVYNRKGVPIGYAMQFAGGTIPLARLFTTGFRDRFSVTPKMSCALVDEMISDIEFIHKNNILIIDLNEFNFLIDEKDLITPYFIDTDSYQTTNFPATVIMPSIRDWHSKSFSPDTDWFSFAIIATQIFIGIHPFKGTHPSFKKSDLEGRMKANISIFNKDVSVPPTTRDFSLIPPKMLSWFVDLFEKGVRCPPSQIGTIVVTIPQRVTKIFGIDKFTITPILETDSIITGIKWLFGTMIIFTQNDLKIDSNSYRLRSKTAGVVLHERTVYSVDIVDNQLTLSDTRSQKAISSYSCTGSHKLIIDNRIYIINDDGMLTEIKVKKFGDKIMLVPGTSWDILPNSTQCFRNVVYSNMLNKAFLYIPFEEDACSIIPVPELNGYIILDAVYEDRVCILLVHDRKGIYYRVILKFNLTISKYECEIEPDVSNSSINMVSLNKIYLILGDGEMIIGSKDLPDKKVISDVSLGAGATLYHDKMDVYFTVANTLQSIKMK
jgi:hypothetical protein